MTLDQLQYALQLQRTKSFSKAAEACFITQPSLSIQIAKLEDELGVMLFNRTRAGVVATEYGEELLRQARRIMDEAARLPQLARELKGEVRGHFRLGVIPTLAPSLLPLFLREFGERYPGVQLSVVEERTERLVQEIDEGTLDGAILSTPSKCPASLMEKVLFYEPFVVFASQSHEILKSRTISVSQISSEEILLLDETHCLRDQVLQLCKLKQKSGESRLRIQSASLQTLIEFIRHDRAYTLLPQLSASLLSSTEQLKFVRPLEKPVPSRKVSLVFHQSRLKRSIIDALKDSIMNSLPKSVFPTTSGHELRVLSPSLEHFEI